MKDLNEFLNEDKKDRPLREGEGKDDQAYIDAMGYYKHVARHTMKPEEANKYLQKALKIKRDGDVSDDAKLGAAYI